MPHPPELTKQSWSDHFPPTKIKGVLQAQEEIGQLREPVVRLVSAASALFINDLVKSARPADSKLITLEDLKRVVGSSEQYSAILDKVGENIYDVDDSCPYQAKKATKSCESRSTSPNPPISNRKRIKPDILIQEAMKLEEHNIEQERPPNADLVIDDDDYD